MPSTYAQSNWRQPLHLEPHPGRDPDHSWSVEGYPHCTSYLTCSVRLQEQSENTKRNEHIPLLAGMADAQVQVGVVEVVALAGHQAHSMLCQAPQMSL